MGDPAAGNHETQRLAVRSSTQRCTANQAASVGLQLSVPDGDRLTVDRHGWICCRYGDRKIIANDPGQAPMGISVLEAKRLVDRCLNELAVPADFRVQGDDFEATQIDEYGSIRIRPRSGVRAGHIEGAIVDAEFHGFGSEPVFAILFAVDGILTELQVYRGDGLPLERELSATEFTLFPGMALTHLARTGEIPLAPPIQTD